jgi:hypothetical protein
VCAFTPETVVLYTFDEIRAMRWFETNVPWGGDLGRHTSSSSCIIKICRGEGVRLISVEHKICRGIDPLFLAESFTLRDW